MKSILLSIALISVNPAFGQLPDNDQRTLSLGNAPTVFHLEKFGFYVQDVYNLAAIADVVIEGKYVRRVDHFHLYTYENDLVVTREAMIERVGDENSWRIDGAAAPVADYEIKISSILKNDGFVEERIILRVFEDNGAERSPGYVEFRTGRHLFFLAKNPDGTYGLHGKMFDMKETPTSYVFRTYNDNLSTAAFSEEKESFVEALQQEIKRQR